MDAADPQFALTVLEARIKHLEAQVEKKHQVAEELKEGLQKQYAQFSEEMDAKDEEVKRLSLQNEEARKALEYIRDDFMATIKRDGVGAVNYVTAGRMKDVAEMALRKLSERRI